MDESFVGVADATAGAMVKELDVGEDDEVEGIGETQSGQPDIGKLCLATSLTETELLIFFLAFFVDLTKSAVQKEPNEGGAEYIAGVSVL